MKKYSIFSFLLVAILTLCACSSSLSNEEKMVGTWEATDWNIMTLFARSPSEGSTIEFYGDGRFDSDFWSSGSWSHEWSVGSSGRVRVAASTWSYEFINDNKLELTRNHDTIILERIN